VFKLAEKMVRLSPRLSKLIKIVPSQKMLIGLPMNVEYKAISAEAGTAHGLSPVLAILDEVGQVRSHYDAFIEAIVRTYQAAICIENEVASVNRGTKWTGNLSAHYVYFQSCVHPRSRNLW
jgi:hypothetical protein